MEIALSVAYTLRRDYGITPFHDIKTIKEDLGGVFFYLSFI